MVKKKVPWLAIAVTIVTLIVGGITIADTGYNTVEQKIINIVDTRMDEKYSYEIKLIELMLANHLSKEEHEKALYEANMWKDRR